MNTIVMIRSNYKSDEEFWSEIVKQLKILVDNNYEILFGYEDCGVYTIDFTHDPQHEDLGEERFICVTPEEEEAIMGLRLGTDSTSSC